jgi:hypothetical protein
VSYITRSAMISLSTSTPSQSQMRWSIMPENAEAKTHEPDGDGAHAC